MKITSFREPGPRYPALRVIGFLCTLLGTILAAIGAGLLIYGLYALATTGPALPANPAPAAGPQPQIIAVLPPLVAGFSLLWSFGILFSGLQLIALGAFLGLMIHLEENTRASAQMLDELRSRLEASPSDTGPTFRS
jgi:hypothetical protein